MDPVIETHAERRKRREREQCEAIWIRFFYVRNQHQARSLKWKCTRPHKKAVPQIDPETGKLSYLYLCARCHAAFVRSAEIRAKESNDAEARPARWNDEPGERED